MAQMMTDGFNIETQSVLAQATRVAQAVTDIQGKLGQLNTDMERLFTDWTGRSATGFSGVHNDWQGQYKKLNTQLTHISEALKKTGEKYVQADTDNTPKVQGAVS
jgi:WXG100 family type VII secretion target